MRLCDQAMCDRPATRITNAGGKKWFSCDTHVATEPTDAECAAYAAEIADAVKGGDR